MIYIIIGFGLAISIAGILIIVNPELIFSHIRRNAGSLYLHVLAVVVRLILGALLIATAGVSKYPLAIEIIGWLSLVGSFKFDFDRSSPVHQVNFLGHEIYQTTRACQWCVFLVNRSVPHSCVLVVRNGKHFIGISKRSIK